MGVNRRYSSFVNGGIARSGESVPLDKKIPSEVSLYGDTSAYGSDKVVSCGVLLLVPCCLNTSNDSLIRMRDVSPVSCMAEESVTFEGDNFSVVTSIKAGVSENLGFTMLW